jgi:D-glycero-alpha-D-manno-heptose 1-phosphate guanylyltransferase
MQAIILAGGFGTRLKHILPDIPKPMAPLQGKPFLHYIVEYLSKQGVTEFVFSTHYLSEQIESYFIELQKTSPNLSFKFAYEAEALGTGGAILNSINLSNANGDVLVLNGDTFVEMDYQKFISEHKNNNSKISLALREVDDTARYGRVEVNGKHITAFREKGLGGLGLINAGNYIIDADWFKQQHLPQKFSFETDFLFPKIAEIKPTYFVASSYFIDIGIPEDYARAQVEIPQMVKA